MPSPILPTLHVAVIRQSFKDRRRLDKLHSFHGARSCQQRTQNFARAASCVPPPAAPPTRSRSTTTPALPPHVLASSSRISGVALVGRRPNTTAQPPKRFHDSNVANTIECNARNRRSEFLVLHRIRYHVRSGPSTLRWPQKARRR